MKMTHVILYLYKRDFLDYGGQHYFCPFCLRVEGLMAMFPEIRHNVDVRYVDFEKPRGELPNLVGEQQQSCPHLLLPGGDDDISGKYSTTSTTGMLHIDKTDHIIDYFIKRFKLPEIHP